MLRSALAIVPILALAGGASAQQPAAGASEVVERALAWAGSATPGCAVAVERGGVRLATVVRGLAELEHGAPLTPDSVFEAGSVAKQFTAAAIVLLAEDGRLSLDDDVRRWFPELPDYGRRMTVRMLLDHTSGLRDWGSLYDLAGWPRTTRVYTQADALDSIARQTALNYEPGAEWSYTNSGYNLAALLVERAGGETLAAFTRRRLFEPLGMHKSGWRDDFRATVAARAVAYRKAPSGAYEQLMPFEHAHGNGGLLTTVGDLLIWNRALDENRFGLGEALTVRTRLNDGGSTRYGLGVFLETPPGRREVSHGGATAGYRAFAGRHWENGVSGVTGALVSTAVLCNAAEADAAGLARAAVDAVLPIQIASYPRGARPATAPTVSGVFVDERTGRPLQLAVAGERVAADGRAVEARGDRWMLGDDEIVFRRDGSFERRSVDGARTVYRVGASPALTTEPALLGRWRSREIDATYVVAAGAAGALTVSIERRPGSATAFQPVYRDAWQGGGRLLRAIRDGRGRVTALSLGEARVRDLRLSRAPD